jgi:hypothetical protein
MSGWLAGAMAYLTQLTVTSSYAVSVLPALAVMGLGFGMIFSPAINTATAGVARRDSGVAFCMSCCRGCGTRPFRWWTTGRRWAW